VPSDPGGPLFDAPIGERIRQAHAEHVASVDRWAGVDSYEKAWTPPLAGGVQHYMAPPIDLVGEFDEADPELVVGWIA
jgi:hypothetical protein